MKNPPNITVDPIAVEAADLINRAADLLEKEGWRTYYVGNPGEPKCIQGAINYVVHGDTDYPFRSGKFIRRSHLQLPSWTLAQQTLHRAMWPNHEVPTDHGLLIGGVCAWNNDATDEKVVIGMLRKTAASLAWRAA